MSENLSNIYVENRRCKVENLKKKYPDALIIDVTSKAEDDFVRFSPFYPHGGIPVPFTEGRTAASVEGIWQGLKVFESCGVDTEVMRNRTMKNLKRTCRRFGRCLGHQKGLGSTERISYLDARHQIYLPSYRWVLENKLSRELKALRIISQTKTVVLLDYETNTDVDDVTRPLSHAGLIKAWLDGCYPE